MIYPKCKGFGKLYVTATNKVRPCCWLNEYSDSKVFDEDDDYDLSVTSLPEVMNNIGEWIDHLSQHQDPILPSCVMSCSNPLVNRVHHKTGKPVGETGNSNQNNEVF